MKLANIFIIIFRITNFCTSFILHFKGWLQIRPDLVTNKYKKSSWKSQCVYLLFAFPNNNRYHHRKVFEMLKHWMYNMFSIDSFFNTNRTEEVEAWNDFRRKIIFHNFSSYKFRFHSWTTHSNNATNKKKWTMDFVGIANSRISKIRRKSHLGAFVTNNSFAF